MTTRRRALALLAGAPLLPAAIAGAARCGEAWVGLSAAATSTTEAFTYEEFLAAVVELEAFRADHLGTGDPFGPLDLEANPLRWMVPRHEEDTPT